MCALLFFNGAPLWANPTGGVVASGSAAISSAGTTTTINQSTAQAIINWQQFSIASNEATKFFVPTAASVTLNRVLGGNPSAIYGSLSSNGQLILVNPSGIVVGPSGRIDTAGFIGSTLAISDSDFLQGNLHFTGDGSATVDNEGTIHATGGDVYLIGSQVTNGGAISAPQGTAGLAAGSDILFEQSGDEHLYVQPTPLSATRAVGVTNSGTIHAAAAELKAAGGNAYALAINNTGQITATGFKKIGGQVFLTADGGDIDNSGTIVAHNANGNGGKIVLNGYGTSSNGTVLNSGKLIATGRKSGKTGGTVEVLGNQVGITGFGLVDVSGDAGGGTALIGGDEHGANAAVPDADQTYLGPDATIKADAFTLGNGGKVILWGNKTTQAYGAISARGGAQGGNGGFVETSAKTLDVQTVPDLRAPKGTGGTWLLDPSNIYISDTVTVSTAPDASPWGAPFTLTEGGTYDLNQDDLAHALEQDGTVELDASAGTGTIQWNDSTEVFAPALTGASTLTLNGPGGISFYNVTIAPTGAALNINLNTSTSTSFTPGPVQLQNSSITTNNGTFTAYGNGYIPSSTQSTGSQDGIDIYNTTINAGVGDIDLTGNAGYVVQDGVTTVGSGVSVSGTAQEPAVLETSDTGNITIVATVDLPDNVIANQGFSAFNMYGNESPTASVIEVASGLLSIEGDVLAGTVQSTGNDGGITGVSINSGAQVRATAAGGSVTLSGDVSGSTVDVEGSSPEGGTGSTGVEIDNYQGGGTAVGVVGASNGQGGVLTITGKGGTVDTTYSTYSGKSDTGSGSGTGTGTSTGTGTGDLPYTEGVDVNDGTTLTAGANATISITGTGGAIVLTYESIQNGDGSTTVTGGDYTGGSEGVEIEGSSITMGTGGTLTLLGTGGAVNAGYGNNAGDADSQGVGIEGGDEGTEVISVADGGSISLTGYGGAIDNSNAAMVYGKDMPSTQGVSVDAGVQLEAAGSTTISITGTAGNINSGANTDGDAIGVNIGSGDDAHDQDTLVSSVTGDIAITGYSGDTPNLGLGAEAHGFGSHQTTIETTGGGNISMTGTGGSGYTQGGKVSGNSVPDSGTALIDDVLVATNVSTTGTVPGSITLVGTGDSYSNGVVVQELGDNQVIDSSPSLPVIQAGGALSIYALEGTGEYINGTITAHSATFGVETLVYANTVGFQSDVFIEQGTPTITSGNLTIANSTVTLTGGNFTAYGAGYANYAYGNANPDGIDVQDSTINGAGGDITMTGTGGYLGYIDESENTTYYAGTPVSISNDSAGTTSIDTTGAGNITITGTNDNGVTVVNGLFGVTIYGTSTDTFSTELSVANGLLSVNGKVLSGTADGTNESGADLGGINIQNSTLTATGTGSITLDGDVSAANSVVSGSNFSFVSGIEIGTGSMISAQGDGTITLDGTGGSIDASSYTGGPDDGVFSVGVQLDNSAQVIGADGASIIVDGTQASDATAVDADMFGTLINLGAVVKITGTGGEISLTGTTTGTTVTSSAGGNYNDGLEIDNSNNESEQATEISIDADGTLILSGTSGSVDATANSDESNQAGAAGIYVGGGAEIFADTGAGVTITGTGGAATTTTGFTGETTGVAFDDAAVTFNGDNVVSITGYGGAADDGANVASNTTNPAESAGVYFDHGSASLVSVGDGSSLTVHGYGGALDTTNGSASSVGDTFPITVGIEVNSNIEATGDATITLNGTGGAVGTSDESTPTVGASFGVSIGGDNHGVQVSSETGNISITGTAGNAPNLGVGVVLHAFNGNELLLQSTSGDITITGTGGSGNSGAGDFTGFFEPNYGVLDLNEVEIKTTAGGTVTITGTDGSGDVNGAGVALTTTNDTSVDANPIEPDINASGAVTLNALSEGGLLVNTATIEASSLQVGSATLGEDNVLSISSGPVAVSNSSLDVAGAITVYGDGGQTSGQIAGISINDSTLNANGADINVLEQGGSANDTGLLVENGSMIETTGNGSITLSGTISQTTSGGDLEGFVLASSTVEAGAGAISLTGAVHVGIVDNSVNGLVMESSSIEALQSGGSVTLVGDTSGSIASDTSNVGLTLYTGASQVSTLDGPGISITGTSGGVSLDSNATGSYATYGVSLGANISTGGTAPITITGNGGGISGDTSMASELQATGVDLFNDSGSAETMSTAGGTITIKGYGGNSPNSGFGVFVYGFAGSPYNVQSASGNILVTGVAGDSPTVQSVFSSGTYEPNIGVALADAVNVSTSSGSISVTGTGLNTATTEGWNGSGLGIQIDSFAGYNDNAGEGGADSAPTTPQLSAGGTISLVSLLGTVDVDQETQIPTQVISGNFIVSTPVQADPSVIDNLSGTVTLENGADYDVNSSVALTVQTGTGGARTVAIGDNAGIILGAMTASSLELESDAFPITQTGALDLGALTVDSSSSITLMNSGNNISVLHDIDSSGAISIYTDPGLALDSGVLSGGPVLFESIGGGITLDPGATVIDNGPGNISLVTNEAFVNNSKYGGSALEAVNGYTYIYAGDQANTSLGGVTVAFTQYDATYPSTASSPGNGLFYSGYNPSQGTTTTTTTNPPGDDNNGNLPPVVSAPIQGSPVYDPTPITFQTPPFTLFGTGNVGQTGQQTGGLAYSSGSGGQVGAGDAAQLNNGQMNNVSNPRAAGTLDSALSGAVHETLEDALLAVGAFADSSTYGDTSTGDSSGGGSDDNKKNKNKNQGAYTNTPSNEQVIGPGGVVEMGGNGVQQIPPGSAPPQLQNALGNGVLQGLQPAGH